MKKVVFSCPFIPPEWIAAHGLLPVRGVSPQEEKRSYRFSEGLCPYVSVFLDSVDKEGDVAGILFSTVCDQMRRGSECLDHVATPVFLVNVPATWLNEGSKKLYVSELKRLGRFLERIGGRSPSREDLGQKMAEYQDRRSVLMKSRRRWSPRIFSGLLMDFLKGEAFNDKLPEEDDIPSGIPVAFLGGPLTPEDLPLFDMVREEGGVVALDASETGERTIPRPFDPVRMKTHPLEELADAYFGYIPDVYRIPDEGLYSWLKDMIVKREIRGILLLRNIWCDTWHGEVSRLKDRVQVPVLEVDLTHDRIGKNTETRIRAFMETLR